ncbi:MAG: hypothetical protein RJA07_1847 [Bacteroidota bacterium]|jgi:putative acetyltransferase
MIIETESEKDFSEIYNLVKIAFQTAEHADGNEQDYVTELRKTDRYIPELAFIAKEGNELIGHIMLTKTIVSTDIENWVALLLSPVCVKFEYRKKGIGAALIQHSLKAALQHGFKAVFLVGEPNYYGKFGFQSISNFGIKDTGSIPEQYTLVVEIDKSLLKQNGGTVSIC